MKSAALTSVLALSLSAVAVAQETRTETRAEARNDREYKNEYDQLIISLRTTLPGGEAFSGVRWNDLISGGLGVDVEYCGLWQMNSWAYGGWFIGLGVDSFGGRTFTPPGGDELRTDRLNTADLEVGPRFRQNLKGFHIDESIGVGAVMYMKQDFADRTLGVDKLELIKASANYMFDVGARIGAPIGKNVDLSLGAQYRINGAPSEGKDVSGIKFKIQQNVVFALSLDIGF
jgi:hypothetical protein